MLKNKLTKQEIEGINDLRDKTGNEIRVYEYERFYLIKVNQMLTLVKQEKNDYSITKLGYVENFKLIDDINYLNGREIEMENRLDHNKNYMPSYVWKALLEICRIK
jgi:hypothetical protein